MDRLISIRVSAAPGSIMANVAAVLQRELEERCELPVVISSTGRADVALQIDSGLAREGYEIRDGTDGTVTVKGGSERGLLYGVGKLLRTADMAPGRLALGQWRGTAVPEKEVRGMYLATHFHNYYHDAPIAEVTRYVEEMALWGINVISVWFDMHHFHGMDDPEAQTMMARLKAILRAAKAVGLDASLTLLANEAYANSPEELRADWTAGHDGYHHPPQGHYHVELCPSKPGASELLLRWLDEKLQAFADISLDYLWIWPYDQGGCTCALCRPWGVNGFLRMAEPIARRFRTVCPRGKVILSTWYFDHFTDGEWEGLDRAFAHPPDWVDYLLVDDYGDFFPPYPLQHGAPGNLPMVGFPEISMYRASPWGGFGANPFPQHLQALWDSAGHCLAGGFPYSEGIYEDLNKAICAQFYWCQSTSALETVREYVAHEYGSHVVEPLLRAIAMLETTLPRQRRDVGDRTRFVLAAPDRVGEAYELLREVDAQLDARAQRRWRWRILYLRALVDHELAANDFSVSPRCEEALLELTTIYHAQQAAYSVAPPTKESVAANRKA